MSNKARERLRALAHAALIHLEGIDMNARPRLPDKALALEKDVEAIRSFLLKLIGA